MGDYASFGILEIRHSGASLNMRQVKGIIGQRIIGQRTALAVEVRKGVFALLKVWELTRFFRPVLGVLLDAGCLAFSNFEPLKSPRIVSKTAVVQNIEML